MTMLAALARHYERLAKQGEAPPFGYSLETIGWCVVIDRSGVPTGVVSLADDTTKRSRGRSLPVPSPVKRTSAVAANFLWDKTSYALGVTAGEGKRTAREHEAFKALHREALADEEDPGLAALLAFLDRWHPEAFAEPLFPSEMRDANVVFRFAEERGYLHDRPAAKAIWARRLADGGAPKAVCLVSGARAPFARLHPAVKGVWGAQSSGAPFLSFNCDAFESYGHEQGANAPVSERAAFAYATALNRLLAKDSRHRVQIGDASSVFWAEAEEAEKAESAETIFGALLGGRADESLQAGKLRPVLEGIAQGRPLTDLDPKLAAGVRFYLLGLAPNAARLSVRFWFEGDFGRFADLYALHARDMALEPPPRERLPTVQRLAFETAARRKAENIPPQLGGELLRAILTGGRYPASLRATLLMRLRADGEITALRVALLKAAVARDRRLETSPTTKEPPVTYDPECREPGYLLGRLFATYEYAQQAALGRSVNATVKDKFYGAASSTPQSVFPLLDRGSQPHLARLRKERPGQAVNIEKQIGAIMERLDPDADPFPRALPPAQQALFALGYYHERNQRFAHTSSDAATEEANQ